MPQGVVDAHQTRQALVEALRPGPRAQLLGHHPCRLLWPASAGGGTIGAVWQVWGSDRVAPIAGRLAPQLASGLSAPDPARNDQGQLQCRHWTLPRLKPGSSNPKVSGSARDGALRHPGMPQGVSLQKRRPPHSVQTSETLGHPSQTRSTASVRGPFVSPSQPGPSSTPRAFVFRAPGSWVRRSR